MKISQEKTASRRHFLTATAALGGLTPAAVLGANDRIRFAIIGVGGMGEVHLRDLVRRSQEDNLQVVAVCDVYQRRLAQAVAASKAEGYSDYRKVLERKDVDAVLVATPDHWHGKISIDAMEAGKHVYVEKPMTHTVEQAIAVRDAVRRYKKVLQVGVHGTSNGMWRVAHEAIQAGRIGKVTWAQSSFNRNARDCMFNTGQKIDAGAAPNAAGDKHIDWDMWLGHEFGLAPKIPFNPEHFFRFRKYWPYSGGVATDLLYHSLAPLLSVIAGPNGEYPLRVNASGGLYVEKDGRDIPDVFLVTADYPSEFSLFLVSTLTNDSGVPARVYGKYGTMEVTRDLWLQGNGELVPEFKQRNSGFTEVRVAGEKVNEQKRAHTGNFIDAIRGKATLNCNAELGAATMVAIRLAVDSYRQKRTMIWDSARERVAV